MKKGYFSVIIVAIISCALALTMSVYMIITSLGKEEKYVLYVSSSSYTTTTKNDIKAICKKYATSFTLVEASGGYYDDDNASFSNEATLIYTFAFDSEETVRALANEILQTIDGVTIVMETVKAQAVRLSLDEND